VGSHFYDNPLTSTAEVSATSLRHVWVKEDPPTRGGESALPNGDDRIQTVAALSSAPKAPVGTPALQKKPSRYFVILNKFNVQEN
jgi:hypothetical protein